MKCFNCDSEMKLVPDSTGPVSGIVDKHWHCPTCGQNTLDETSAIKAPQDYTISTVATPLPIGTELQVCQDITARQQHGLAKYGVSVQDNPLTLKQWLQHSYEECLDQAIYLRRAIEELDKQPPSP
jgi:hypothetical protein